MGKLVITYTGSQADRQTLKTLLQAHEFLGPLLQPRGGVSGVKKLLQGKDSRPHIELPPNEKSTLSVRL